MEKLIRTLYIPLVNDEIATFHYYIQTADLLPYRAHWDVNNHFVNSAITKLEYKIFGLSLLTMRLGNLEETSFCHEDQSLEIFPFRMKEADRVIGPL